MAMSRLPNRKRRTGPLHREIVTDGGAVTVFAPVFRRLSHGGTRGSSRLRLVRRKRGESLLQLSPLFAWGAASHSLEPPAIGRS